MNTNYLYIFTHIPRTGGTTLRKHIIKNVKKRRRHHIKNRILRDTLFTEDERREAIGEIKAGVEKLGWRVITKPLFIYGPEVLKNISLYALSNSYAEQWARYILLVREPESRAISLYNYLCNLPKTKKLQKLREARLFIDGKIPNFNDWVKYKYAIGRCETQTQQLKKLGYLGESIREFVDSCWFVCPTDKLDEGMPYLAKKLKFRKRYRKQNTDVPKVVTTISEATKELLKEKNKDDNILYQVVCENYSKNINQKL